MEIVSSIICLFGGDVASMGACRSRTNADDRLPADPLSRIESGDGIVEGRDVADVRPQSSVPHPLDDSPSWARSDTRTKSIAGPSTTRRRSSNRRWNGPEYLLTSP